MIKNNYKNICLLVFLSFFIVAPFLLLRNGYSYENNEVLRAFDLAESEKHDKAMKIIDAVLADEPNNSHAYYVKGYIQHDVEEYDLAIQSYTTAIDLAKTHKVAVLAYSGRGNCWREKRVLNKAVLDFTKVIEMEPANTLAYFDRARVWLLLEEFQAAIKDYTSIISINPQEIDAYAKRAALFLKKGEWELALVDLKKIIALDAKHPKTNG